MNRTIRYISAFNLFAILIMTVPGVAQNPPVQPGAAPQPAAPAQPGAAQPAPAQPGAAQPAAPAPANEQKKPIWSYVTLWAGAKLENPYSITVDPTNHTAKLQPVDAKTDGYLELRLRYRFVDIVAANAKQITVFSYNANKNLAERSYSGGFAWDWQGGYPLPDVDTAIGYVFRNSSAPTNFNSSTIVGGSDLYVTGSLGFPYWRYASSSTNDPGMRAVQATLEISGGFVTDRHNLLLHPNIFVGGGFQFLYFRGPESDLLPGFWTGRIGLAQVDQPKLITDSSVALNGRDEPEFKSSWVPALGFDVTFPISHTLSAQFGGNAYFTDSPSSWNLTVGLVVDVDKLFK
jgi:hypothetical protein